MLHQSFLWILTSEAGSSSFGSVRMLLQTCPYGAWSFVFSFPFEGYGLSGKFKLAGWVTMLYVQKKMQKAHRVTAKVTIWVAWGEGSKGKANVSWFYLFVARKYLDWIHGHAIWSRIPKSFLSCDQPRELPFIYFYDIGGSEELPRVPRSVLRCTGKI